MFLAATIAVMSTGRNRIFPGIVLGTALLSGGAAALNQVFEIAADAKMPRTRNRPLPAGRISVGHALAFGLLTGIAGFAHLQLQRFTIKTRSLNDHFQTGHHRHVASRPDAGVHQGLSPRRDR